MATDLGILPTAPAAEDDSILIANSGDSVVLHGISWALYRRLRRTPENHNICMTYDRGELEIMSPSAEHEGIAALLGNLRLFPHRPHRRFAGGARDNV